MRQDQLVVPAPWVQQVQQVVARLALLQLAPPAQQAAERPGLLGQAALLAQQALLGWPDQPAPPAVPDLEELQALRELWDQLDRQVLLVPPAQQAALVRLAWPERLAILAHKAPKA